MTAAAQSRASAKGPARAKRGKSVGFLDETFRDADGKVGFNLVDRQWPQGWKGSGLPHGVVFSR